MVNTRWHEQRTQWGLCTQHQEPHLEFNSRYKEPSGDFVLKLKDQKQLVERAKWGLCTYLMLRYCTLNRIPCCQCYGFRIQHCQYKEPSGDFELDTSIHKMAGTNKKVGTSVPNIWNHIQNSKSRYKEQRAQWGLCAETKGAELAATKSLVGTLYLMLRYTKQDAMLSVLRIQDFNIVSAKSQEGILYLTLEYTRWREQRTLWGLLYPTL